MTNSTVTLSLSKACRFAIVLFSLLWTLPLSAATDKSTVKEFITEPATLLSLGFEWRIDGDDNRNATVAVSYRKKGETAWKDGLPLLRIGNERINENALQYMTPNGFAGSIFDLGSGHRLRSAVCDVGSRRHRGQGGDDRHGPHACRTEAGGGRQGLPRLSAGVQRPETGACVHRTARRVLHRAPRARTTSIRTRRAFSPATRSWFTPVCIKMIGYRYGAGLGTVSSGTYFLTQSGTADKPIVIKAAGDGEAIFDGDGAYNLFNVMAANYNYFEGLTIRNTDLAFQAGLKNITGSSGLTIKRCRFENVGRAIYTDWSGSKDYYIADNVMLGRFNPNYLMGFTGRTWQNLPGVQPQAGVRVRGEGIRLRPCRGVQLHRELP